LPWPKQKDAVAFYGDPSTNNAGWQAANLVTVFVPWHMFMGTTPIAKIRIHVKCATSLGEILDRAWRDIGRDQKLADEYGWSQYSGSYNYRPIRGSKRLSMHAFGCAIDFDASHNQLHSSATDKIGFTAADPLVKAFEAEGWVWGGRWTGRSDPMHFQAAVV
jgi:hypothetical protein